MGGCDAFQVARTEAPGGMLCVELAAAPRRPLYAQEASHTLGLGLAKDQPPDTTRGRVYPPNPGEMARWRAPAARSSVARTPVK